jgi:hypothetical protein
VACRNLFPFLFGGPESTVCSLHLFNDVLVLLYTFQSETVALHVVTIMCIFVYIIVSLVPCLICRRIGYCCYLIDWLDRNLHVSDCEATV